MLPDKVGELPVRVINTTVKPVRLVRNAVLSNLEPVSPLDRQRRGQPPKEGDVKDIIDGYVKDKLRRVLFKHLAVFSKNE